jgi:hypothetical protein
VFSHQPVKGLPGRCLLLPPIGLKLVLGPNLGPVGRPRRLEQASDGIYAHVVRATAR